MADTPNEVFTLIENAKCAEDIFGIFRGNNTAQHLTTLGKRYQRLAKKVHPDAFIGEEEPARNNAEKIFKMLNEFYVNAEEKIRAGNYGDNEPLHKAAFPAIVIESALQKYTLTELLTRGDILNIYRCVYEDAGSAKDAMCKVIKRTSDNAFLENEIRVLAHLMTQMGRTRFFRYLPKIIETLILPGDTGGQERKANVFTIPDGIYAPFEEIKRVYPQGVDPAHAAWMWRRMLEILSFIHAKGVVHGAIIPPHIIIRPQDHGLILLNWEYAIQDFYMATERVRAYDARFESLYAPEILAKCPPGPESDIYMSVKCMIYLLGGNTGTDELPESVPKKLQSFLKSCLIRNPARRPNDAHMLHGEFGKVLRELYGPPKFREFIMPANP